MAKKKGMIPKHELEALAAVLYPTLKEYLTNPQHKTDLAKWQENKKFKEIKKMRLHEEFNQKAVEGDTKDNARLLYELVASHPNAVSHYGIAKGMPCDMYRLAPAKPLSPHMLLQVTTEKDGSNHISIQGSGKYLQYKDPEQQEEFLKLLENF